MASCGFCIRSEQVKLLFIVRIALTVPQSIFQSLNENSKKTVKRK